jgi:hypothetical protein
MYTEEDLRATFGALENEAPEAGVVLARVNRTRQRRRTTGVIAAAMAAAAVVVAGTSVVSHLTDQTVDVAANPHYERWQVPFAVDEVPPGYQVIYENKSSAFIVETGPGVERLAVVGRYILTIFPKGGYDPTVAKAGEPVDIGGKHGFYRAETCTCNSEAFFPMVAWEYAPDSWARVTYAPRSVVGETSSSTEIRKMSLRIAGGVRFDRTAKLRVSFRVGYLPAGFHAVDPLLDPVPSLNETGFGTTAMVTGPAGKQLTVTASPHTDPEVTSPPQTMVEVPEVMTDPTNGTTTVRVRVGQLDLRVRGFGFSADELRTIGHSITPAADVYDPSTWFDADTAMPLH